MFLLYIRFLVSTLGIPWLALLTNISLYFIDIFIIIYSHFIDAIKFFFLAVSLFS